MQNCSNTKVTLEAHSGRSFTILDDKSLSQLKADISKEVCHDIFSKICDTTDPSQSKLNASLNNENSRSAYLRIAKIDIELEALYVQLKQLEDVGTTSSLDPDNIDSYSLEQEQNQLENSATDLRSQIGDLEISSCADDKYSDPEYLSSTLQFYKLSNKKMALITQSTSIIEDLIEATTRQKAKWIALLEDIATPKESSAINHKFAEYKTLLENEIDTNRELSIYFDDLFTWLAQDSYVAAYEDFSNLNKQLVRVISHRTYDLDYLRSEYSSTPTELIPIKEKFSTEQLNNNVEVLNADIAKFALLDNLQVEDLTDIVQQYQVKIKKWQAINKELNARRLNTDISRANFIRNLDPSIDLVELYSLFIDILLQNDAIVHKWKAVDMLRQFSDRFEDIERLKLLRKNLEIVEKRLVEIANLRTMTVCRLQIKDIQNQYNELSQYRADLLAHAEQLHLDEMQQVADDLFRRNAIIYKGLQEDIIAKYNISMDEHLLQIKPAIWNVIDATNSQPSAVSSNITELKAIIEKINHIATTQSEIKQMLFAKEHTSINYTPIVKNELDREQIDVAESNDICVITPTTDIMEDNLGIVTQDTDILSELENKSDDIIAIEDCNNSKNKYVQLDIPQLETANIKKVNDVKEAAELYNIPDFITKSKSNMEYFCKACDKTLKFTGNKPANHCKTTLHNKKFIQWVNKNKLIL
jgi:hypothetical protein